MSNQTVRIVPALLTDDPQKLVNMLEKTASYTNYAQLDFMDGQFVPSSSVTWEDAARAKIQFPWEAHIMVLQPEKYIAGFKQAGAKRLIFHFEATDHHREVIAAVRKSGMEVGIALNPETPVSAVLPLVPLLDTVLFMSVHPGFYGAKFLPEVVTKAVEMRQKWPELHIGMDGGLKEVNAAQIASAGVNDICVGSAILLAPDPGAAFRNLQKLAEDGAKQRK